MLTKALVVERPRGDFLYRDVQVDDRIRANEVLVDIVASGICHADINFSEHEIEGMYPVVLGHEGAGIITKVGAEVTNVKVGDRVVLSYTSCGDCRYCLTKQAGFCNSWEKDNFGVGRGKDGSKAYSFPSERGEVAGQAITSHFFGQSSFSKVSVADSSCCVKVGEPGDDSLDLSTLAPLGCGILTGAGAILNVLKPSEEDVVCVVGAGAVGLAAIMALNLLEKKPKKIVVVDIVEEKLRVAQRFGATQTINSTIEKDLPAALRRVTNGVGVDSSIDATGRSEVVKDLLDATAKLGTVCSVGVGKLDASINLNIFNSVTNGRKYVGCCMGNAYPPDFVPRLIQGWKDGKFPFPDLIKRYRAEDVEVAKKEVLSGEVVKAVLVW